MGADKNRRTLNYRLGDIADPRIEMRITVKDNVEITVFDFTNIIRIFVPVDNFLHILKDIEWKSTAH